MARGLEFQIKGVEGLYYLYVAKTMALLSCAVTAQLICAFAFSHAKSRFSHYAAQIVFPAMVGMFYICLGAVHTKTWYISDMSY